MPDRDNPLTAALATDTPGLRRLKTIGRWVTGDPFMLSVSPGPLAVVASDVVSAVYEYLNLALLLDATGLYFGAADVRARGAALTRVVAALGDVDTAIGVASYRASRSDWTRPHFVPPGSPALLVGVVHPLVPDAVPNTITLQPGRGVLVTGSNMSGKSTFLRTVGVTAVMAQTINTCLASRYEAPRLVVQSSIGRADDLLSGRSYYIVEVERLLSLVAASASRTPHLFLLDELFRGTNAIERIAAGQAILMALIGNGSRRAPHVALAATHDGELVDLLPDAYAAHHFGDALGPDGLTFDHRLRSGPATSRNAIALLRLHGAPTAVVESATQCAAALDRERGNSLIGR
jgi:DNA mismatch repair ATPase MutS